MSKLPTTPSPIKGSHDERYHNRNIHRAINVLTITVCKSTEPFSQKNIYSESDLWITPLTAAFMTRYDMTKYLPGSNWLFGRIVTGLRMFMFKLLDSLDINSRHFQGLCPTRKTHSRVESYGGRWDVDFVDLCVYCLGELLCVLPG